VQEQNHQKIKCNIRNKLNKKLRGEKISAIKSTSHDKTAISLLKEIKSPQKEKKMKIAKPGEASFALQLTLVCDYNNIRVNNRYVV